MAEGAPRRPLKEARAQSSPATASGIINASLTVNECTLLAESSRWLTVLTLMFRPVNWLAFARAQGLPTSIYLVTEDSKHTAGLMGIP